MDDGREVITTTTVTVSEDGGTTEEVVTEIIESQEVASDSEVWAGVWVREAMTVCFVTTRSLTLTGCSGCQHQLGWH